MSSTRNFENPSTTTVKMKPRTRDKSTKTCSTQILSTSQISSILGTRLTVPMMPECFTAFEFFQLGSDTGRCLPRGTYRGWQHRIHQQGRIHRSVSAKVF
mmetsp:Transcript_5522/g.12553  ORF Transcript_5522/g.12553 Transcript_5522/m.12553 type:complete len:100 (-) Transcript_5522:1373-1672(-)